MEGSLLITHRPGAPAAKGFSRVIGNSGFSFLVRILVLPPLVKQPEVHDSERDPIESDSKDPLFQAPVFNPISTHGLASLVPRSTPRTGVRRDPVILPVSLGAGVSWNPTSSRCVFPMPTFPYELLQPIAGGRLLQHHRRHFATHAHTDTQTKKKKKKKKKTPTMCRPGDTATQRHTGTQEEEDGGGGGAEDSIAAAVVEPADLEPDAEVAADEPDDNEPNDECGSPMATLPPRMVEVTETRIRNGEVLWSAVFPREAAGALDEPVLAANQGLPPTLGERIREGLSVVTLAHVLSAREVIGLKEACIATAATKSKSNQHPVASYFAAFDNEHIQNRLVYRLPCRSAALRNGNLKDALPPPISDQLEQDILPRILALVDDRLPASVKKTLFATNKPRDDPHLVYDDAKQTTADDDENDEEISVSQLYRENRLYFSTREPAVNVYKAPHAFIGTHKDKEHLTALISFSDPATEFEGGGTGFYKEQFVQEGRHEPSLVVKPTVPGTVILFGGTVEHCGLHTRKGTRVMFVSSFSRDDKQPDDPYVVG